MKLFIVASIVLVMWAGHLKGQCDSLHQVQMERDTFYSVIDDSTVDYGNVVYGNVIVPYYNFDYQQDSCRTKFRIGEFALNSNWIHLYWCDQKVYNFDEQGDSARWDYTNAQLSAISRTRTFSVSSGDTLGFFREMFWFDNATNSYNPSRIDSDDELYFSVELVNASNGARVMLLDTLSLASSSGTTPCIFMWRPVVARIGFIVPGSVGTINAYIRVNVSSNGVSGSRFMRYDDMTIVKSSEHLSDADWKTYVANVASANNCSQSCTYSPSGFASPKRIQVAVNGGQTAVDQIDVIDLSGNLMNSTALPTSSPYSVSIVQTGLYIVVGYKNGSFVCSKLVYVP